MDVEQAEEIYMLPFYKALENNRKNIIYYLLQKYKEKGNEKGVQFDTSLFYFTNEEGQK